MMLMAGWVRDCTHPHTYSLNPRDESGDWVLTRKLSGLPAARRSRRSLKIACLHERSGGRGWGWGVARGLPHIVFQVRKVFVCAARAGKWTERKESGRVVNLLINKFKCVED